MKTSERFFIFFVGFMIGLAIVSAILMRRAAKNEAVIQDPWAAHTASVEAANAETLPKSTEPSILLGKILDFGYLPNKEAPIKRVWILNFEDSYPLVRVVETLADGNLQYMAADQIQVELAEGVDVTDLSPMLDALQLRLRNFNRKHDSVVLGVLHQGLDAVPDTLKALEPWALLIKSAQPDTLRFRKNIE
jgi:hypothetical protein